VVWQLLGAARGLALHPTWRGPLGTLTNSADSSRATLAAAAPAAPAAAPAAAARGPAAFAAAAGIPPHHDDTAAPSAVPRPAPVHFLTSASLVTFGDKMAIPTGVTVLPGAGPHLSTLSWYSYTGTL